MHRAPPFTKRRRTTPLSLSNVAFLLLDALDPLVRVGLSQLPYRDERRFFYESSRSFPPKFFVPLSSSVSPRKHD